MLMLVIISWSFSFSYWIWAHDLHILSTHFSRLIVASIVDILSSLFDLFLFTHFSCPFFWVHLSHHCLSRRRWFRWIRKISNLVKLTWDCEQSNVEKKLNKYSSRVLRRRRLYIVSTKKNVSFLISPTRNISSAPWKHSWNSNSSLC